MLPSASRSSFRPRVRGQLTNEGVGAVERAEFVAAATRRREVERSAAAALVPAESDGQMSAAEAHGTMAATVAVAAEAAVGSASGRILYLEAAALHEALRDAVDGEEHRAVAAALAVNAHKREIWLMKQLQEQQDARLAAVLARAEVLRRGERVEERPTSRGAFC